MKEMGKEGIGVQQSWSKNGYYMVYLFMIGLFIGILVVNVGHDTWIVDSDLLGTEMILRLKNSIPQGDGLFGYVLKHRMFTLCMLALLSTTMVGVPVICIYICYMGLSAGCLLSVAVIRYGIRGLLFVAAGLLPQAFCLVPAYIGLFIWSVNLNRTLYAPKTYLDGYERYSKQFYLKKGTQIVVVAAVVIMGCLLESYVNPKIVHFVLKIF